MTTAQPRAPASRIAQARHPRRLREMRAFQPRSAQMARMRISMSLPNWRRLVSECICCSARPPLPFWSVDPVGDVAYAMSPLTDECRLPILFSLRVVLARLVTGDSGISWASGSDRKLVMASMTRTRIVLAPLAEGVILGAVSLESPARNSSSVQLGFASSSER